MTLYDYLKAELDAGHIDHALRATLREDGTIGFYIHASNSDSQTADFEVRRFGEVAAVNQKHGFTPEGYEPCSRLAGHSGPCAHAAKYQLQFIGEHQDD